MSTDSEHHRPSFRFRDKFSRFKEKLKDKAVRHNITLFTHHHHHHHPNQTTYDNYSQPIDTAQEQHHRHGFRQQMHHMKDVLKNKTHYYDLKEKVKEKLDIDQNKTYPKGFYDSLFSPETENDHYLQTALICLWVIALLAIIPTIIVIFLPARKRTTTSRTSTNMIFFHIFLCELCYLTYILLAMINVSKDFHLATLWCDIANYGMYVTIPMMQFALLFLSLERLSHHVNLPLTWTKIFTKPYLIQVILWTIWILLIALLLTFMFIRKQFNFNIIKDQVHRLAPPIVGDVVGKVVSRRHHCSIDGRLSSVVKTVIIILFVILIVKPIIISLSFNFLTPFCCRKRKNTAQIKDRRTTTLVTIFLLLNLFFSFPYYFSSMFKSIFTNIDSTKEKFTLILKICFILRITNIIFECLAFYIFERNSWSLLSKCFYYLTCKKFPSLKATSIDNVSYTKKQNGRHISGKNAQSDLEDNDDDNDDDDDDNKSKGKSKNKQTVKKKPEVLTESEPQDDDNDNNDDDQDDDGSFVKKPKRKVKTDDDDETPIIKRKKQSNKKPVKTDEDDDDDDDDEDKTDTVIKKKRKPQPKKVQSDEEEDDEEEPQKVIKTKRKSKIKKEEDDDDDDDKNEEEEEEEEEEITKITPKTSTHRKTRTKKTRTDNDDDDDDEERQITTTTSKRKSRPKVVEEEEEEEEIEFIQKPKVKPHRTNTDHQTPNGNSQTHRPSSKPTKTTQRHSTIKVRSTPSPAEESDHDDDDAISDVSQASSKKLKPRTKTRPSSSTEGKRSRTTSPYDQQQTRHQTTSSKPRVKKSTTTTTTIKKSRTQPAKKSSTTPKKKSKKDHQTRILAMSDDV